MPISRVTQQMLNTGVMRNIFRNTNRLAVLNEQLASGKQFSRTSDSPIGFQSALDFRNRLSTERRFGRNIERADNNLSLTESSLSSVTTMVSRLKELAVQASNDTIGAQGRKSIAYEMREILDEALQVANTRNTFGYLFGGDKTQVSPFERLTGASGDYIVYRGDLSSREIEVGRGVTVNTTLNGMEAFFAQAQRLTGMTFVTDTGAALDAQLAGAVPPVTSGNFTINGKTIDVDVTTDSLEDLVVRINRAEADVEASINTEGRLQLESRRSIDIEASSGTSNILETLGVFHRVTGMDVGSVIDGTFPVAFLGLTGESLRVNVGDSAYDVDLRGVVTVQDVLDRINASGAPVRASINATSNGLDLFATRSTDQFSIENNRVVYGSNIGGIMESSPLGAVGLTPPPLTSININNNGTVTSVDLSTAVTVGDVLRLINESGANVTASINAGSNGINIASNLPGSVLAGPLTISEAGGGTTGAQLGILGSVSANNASDLGIAGTGERIEREGINLFQTILDLASSLETGGDREAINRGLARIDIVGDHHLNNLAIIGSRVNRVDLARARVEESDLFLTKLISENEDVDLAEIATQISLQEAVLQGTLNAAGRVLQPTLLEFLR